MTTKRISKAERERRQYIDDTASRVAAHVVQALASKELEKHRKEVEFQDAQAYRNAGAVQLARLLADLSDQEDGMVAFTLCEEIRRISREGGTQVLMWGGKQIYPLPLAEVQDPT